jgi:hypothetical protein
MEIEEIIENEIARTGDLKEVINWVNENLVNYTPGWYAEEVVEDTAIEYGIRRKDAQILQQVSDENLLNLKKEDLEKIADILKSAWNKETKERIAYKEKAKKIYKEMGETEKAENLKREIETLEIKYTEEQKYKKVNYRKKLIGEIEYLKKCPIQRCNRCIDEQSALEKELEQVEKQIGKLENQLRE